MAAASQVGNTYELLENILLHLPLRQLLLAQKVNKKFHAVIQDSLQINQALFWKPISTDYVEWEPGPIVESLRYGGEPLNLGRWKQFNSEENVITLKNPFIHILNQYDERTQSSIPGVREQEAFHLNCKKSNAFSMTYRLPCIGEGDCYLCHGYQRNPLNTSLARMLLSHPPLRTASIQQDSRIDVGNLFDDDAINYTTDRGSFSISSSEGLRCGELRARLAAERDDEAEDEEFRVVGSGQWWNVPEHVDKVTGWETPRILQTDRHDVEALLKDAYLQRLKPKPNKLGL